VKISVIIPSYKPQDYLWECLRSLILQDFPKNEFEILIILNGCCEPYFNQIKAFTTAEMTGFNVSIHQTDESGVSNARNIGMRKATGEYIAFVDDDDKISPSYLTKLYEVSAPNIISVSNVKCFNESNGNFSDDYLSNAYLKNQEKKKVCLFDIRSFMSTACCKLIPAHVIRNRQFDTKFTNGEDSLFMFLISDKIKEYTLADSNAIYYRTIRSGSASRNKTKAFLFKNKMRLFLRFFCIYLSSPFKYNFLFFLTRIGAVLITCKKLYFCKKSKVHGKE